MKKDNGQPKSEPYKLFDNALQDLAYTQSNWTVFNDFLDYAMLLIRWWDVKEEMFEDLKKKYPKPEQHKLFAEAYMAMAAMADGKKETDIDGSELPAAGFNDPFGDYFMEHFSNDRAGQFFTPIHICDMMSIMTLGDVQDDQTICDPTCGSGRFLLSSARIARKGNKRLKYYGADIDITCVKMTLINMMLNSMPGEVAHMDSLACTIWKAYKIMLVPYGDHFLPMYLEIQPHQSAFIHYSIPSNSNEKVSSPQSQKPQKEFAKAPKGDPSQLKLF